MARRELQHGVVRAALALLMGAGCAVAMADEGIATGGYLGLSPEHSLQISERWNARFGPTRFNHDPGSSFGSFDDVPADPSGTSAFLDFRPVGGAFRLSGGLLNALPGEESDRLAFRNSGSLAYPGNLSSDNRPDSLYSVPYLGIGWNSPEDSAGGWGFNVDVGMLFPGYSDRTPWSRGDSSSDGGARLGADLDRGLSTAGDEGLDDSSDDWERVPVFSIGARYRW